MEFGGPNSSDLLCLQEEKISDLELRVDWLGLNDIIYFSVRQSLHGFVTGLKVGILLFRNIREIVGWWPPLFCLWKCVESVVLLWCGQVSWTYAYCTGS